MQGGIVSERYGTSITALPGTHQTLPTVTPEATQAQQQHDNNEPGSYVSIQRARQAPGRGRQSRPASHKATNTLEHSVHAAVAPESGSRATSYSGKNKRSQRGQFTTWRCQAVKSATVTLLVAVNLSCKAFDAVSIYYVYFAFMHRLAICVL